MRETFRWNGAVGEQTGEGSADCEKRGDHKRRFNNTAHPEGHNA